MTDQNLVSWVQSESDRIAARTRPEQNAPAMTVSDRIRARLRDALADRKLSQRAISDRLQKFTGETWSQPRVGKILNGRVELKIEDLALLAGLAGISLVELVREQGREFVADLTPTELRIVNALRDHHGLQDHVLTLIELLAPPQRKPSREVIRERMRLKDD